MLGFASLTLRQAHEALKNERLEEAHRLLSQPDARGHKGSWDLQQQLVRAFVDRGRRSFQHDDLGAAWKDLLLAEEVGASHDEAMTLRQDLAGKGLGEARSLLAAGEPGRALDILEKLKQRAVQATEMSLLEEAARSWVQARDLAARGDFAPAKQAAYKVRRLSSPEPAALTAFLEELTERAQTFPALVEQMHDAVRENGWREVLRISEQVLALAPQHEAARKLRGRAWKSVEASTTPAATSPTLPRGERPEPGSRFMLWMDGVGGFLVCLNSRVTMGQQAPDAFVDMPLVADVSRMHAALTRDSEGYLLEAMRHVQVNGTPAERTLLRSGDRVTLGKSCQFLFTQPVPVSASAKIEITSGHRLPLAIDQVYLMADTLVIGPGPQAHVVMPDLEKPVILFRQKEGLGIRHAGRLWIDGQPVTERGQLTPESKVTGDFFAFAVEPVRSQLDR